ncbi:MAG TPA: rod shape-determining protein MreD [Gammaproteobacteria bacterium]|nr:rod shape-determining protein MreD [Gammaproteobacteria bacterium]
MAVVNLRNIWPLPATLLVAMMLTLMPLPDWARAIRPDWLGLLAIFWSMVLPRTFSIGSAWIVGLLLDAIIQAPFGQNALGLVIIVYITSRMNEHLLSAPLIQQTMFVFILLLTRQVLTVWINGISGHLPPTLTLLWLPPLLSVILWPWLFILLRNLARRYRMI